MEGAHAIKYLGLSQAFPREGRQSDEIVVNNKEIS